MMAPEPLPSTVQVTAVFVRPVTVAVKAWVPPGAREAAPGLTVTTGGGVTGGVVAGPLLPPPQASMTISERAINQGCEDLGGMGVPVRRPAAESHGTLVRNRVNPPKGLSLGKGHQWNEFQIPQQAWEARVMPSSHCKPARCCWSWLQSAVHRAAAGEPRKREVEMEPKAMQAGSEMSGGLGRFRALGHFPGKAEMLMCSGALSQI